jgi:hypothetical protein
VRYPRDHREEAASLCPHRGSASLNRSLNLFTFPSNETENQMPVGPMTRNEQLVRHWRDIIAPRYNDAEQRQSRPRRMPQRGSARSSMR